MRVDLDFGRLEPVMPDESVSFVPHRESRQLRPMVVLLLIAPLAMAVTQVGWRRQQLPWPIDQLVRGAHERGSSVSENTWWETSRDLICFTLHNVLEGIWVI